MLFHLIITDLEELSNEVSHIIYEIREENVIKEKKVSSKDTSRKSMKVSFFHSIYFKCPLCVLLYIFLSHYHNMSTKNFTPQFTDGRYAS